MMSKQVLFSRKTDPRDSGRSSGWVKSLLLLWLLMVCVTPKAMAIDPGHEGYQPPQVVNQSINPDKPYLQFKVHIYNTYGNDSRLTQDLEVTIDGKFIGCFDLDFTDGSTIDARVKSGAYYRLLGAAYGWDGVAIPLAQEGYDYYAMVYLSCRNNDFSTFHTDGVKFTSYWSTDGGTAQTRSTSYNFAVQNGKYDGWYDVTPSSTYLDLNNKIHLVNEQLPKMPSGWQIGVYQKSNRTSSSYSRVTGLGANKTTTGSGGVTWSHDGELWDARDYSVYFTCEKDNYLLSDKNINVGTIFFNSPVKSFSIKGFRRPENLSSTFNQWTREVKLTWINKKTDYDSGTWMVTREKDGQRVVLKDNIPVSSKEVDYRYTDIVPDYSTSYKYYVSFLPSRYTSSTVDVVPNLYAQVSDAVKERKFDIDLSVPIGGANSMQLNWECDTFDNAGYKFIIEGTAAQSTPELPANVVWTKVGEVDVTDATCKNYTFTDKTVGKFTDACGHYFYRISVKAMDKNFVSKAEYGTLTGKNGATKVSATRGSYNGVVKVSWDAVQVGETPNKYTLQRRSLTAKEDEVWTSIYTVTGTASSYFYEDVNALPGEYYAYRVLSVVECSGGTTTTNTESIDGFSIATGVISGRVTYGTGTAVPDVKVIAESDLEDGVSAFHSLLSTKAGSGQGIQWTCDTTELKNLLCEKSWTTEMWICPAEGNSTTDIIPLWNVDKTATLGLKYDDGAYYLCTSLLGNNSGAIKNFTKLDGTANVDSRVPVGKWSNVAMWMEKDGSWGLYMQTPDGDVLTYTSSEMQKIAEGVYNKKANSMTIANTANLNAASSFVGNVDEFRFFTRKLSDQDYSKNTYHMLSGNETGLAIYYPLDEGIPVQKMAYDYSKTSGAANGRHASIIKMSVSDEHPSEDQFSLCAVTDSTGNYTIRGVPFSGEGTNYSIRPKLGVHKFDPTTHSRYVSASSLIHSGVDFTDKSSFSVKGAVYYKDTNFPVEGVTLYVDGASCARDGQIITTDSKGEFTISVPIGAHYISVAKQGHTFCNYEGKSFKNNGYYPNQIDDINMQTVEFTADVSGLTFFDTTLVPIAGRVVGGDIEGSKPLGFGQSRNNIGKATIKLTASNTYNLNTKIVEDESSKDYVANDVLREFSVPTDATCSSTTTAGANADAGIITITTDSKTGEFAAMLPPLKYTVTSVSVDNNKSIAWSQNELVDASDVIYTQTDSIEAKDGTMKRFTYNASLKKIYHSTPVLEFAQDDNKLGAFGESSYVAQDALGKESTVSLYDKKATFTLPNGNPSSAYTFGYPVFIEGRQYKNTIHVYELYENHDADAPEGYQFTEVPLEGTTVTISNRISDGTSIFVGGEEDGGISESTDVELELDENGCAVYEWRAGLPNIQAPYTHTMDITYLINGELVTWGGNGFAGITLGTLPTGKNFVTSGPDQVLMVLRDPPGTASSAYVEKGQTFTHTFSHGGSVKVGTETMTNTKFGESFTLITGTAAGALVASTIETNYEMQLNVGLNVSEEVTLNKTKTRTVTTTKRISTSDQPDFVGSVGDVFIGTATNYIFGDAREVGIQIGSNGKAELDKRDIISVGTSFGTEFQYTQNEVKNVLIPNFETIRNKILRHVDKNEINSIVNDGDEPIYLTTLNPSDKGFGSNNCDAIWGFGAAASNAIEGPSYRMVIPQKYLEVGKDGKTYVKKGYVANDTIRWYNTQIQKWKEVLADNEKAKVTAIENRSKYLKKNLSFDAGVAIDESVSISKSEEFTTDSETSIVAIVGMVTDFEINGTGVELDHKVETGGSVTLSVGDSEEYTTEVGYTLMEDGDDDVLTVDVLNAPDEFGPIFYTRGGQTCCPYEDAVVTDYYRPGFVISEKTMQIEQPYISAETTTVTGVSSGKPATFTVYLQNTSETDEDVWFGLNVVDTTNPHGASVMMDGFSLTNGRTILVPAGQTVTKTIQISQTDKTVYEYDKIKIGMWSLCQPDNTGVFHEIASYVELTAHFEEASSDVDIAANQTAINLQTGTVPVFTINNFDIHTKNLYSVKFQYQLEGDAKWTNAKEWLVGDEYIKDGTFEYPFDMSDEVAFPDGDYNFRAVCTSKVGSKEITTPSSVITINKDVNRPQLIANASPTDGIYNAGDEISLTFNEDIRYGAMAKNVNFYVRGELNDAKVDHAVALKLTGSNAAKTQSRIDLSGKSFAADMWIQYKGKGHILTHGGGSEQFDLSVDADGHLVATVGDKSYTSASTLPEGKWLFLSTNYNAEAKTLSSHYATDASEVILFSDKEVGEYNGFGSLAFGEGLTGQMHDVALWENARTWTDAQSEMYDRKSRYTGGLMGYWRMNEGHGETASDIARNRSLTLPSANSWYMENKNYALELDGKSAYAAPLGSSLRSSESYVAELWFRADKENADAASIVSFGTNDLDIRLNNKGAMEMIAKGSSYPVSTTDYRDGQWHHLALNVLKSSNGNATVYVDGKAKKSISASSLPTFAAAKLYLGSRHNNTENSFSELLKGAVDEVRVWKGRYTAGVITENMYSRVDDEDENLLCYFPFEYNTVDEGALPIQKATLNDQSSAKAGSVACMNAGGSQPNTKLSDANVMGLKAAPKRENVDFNFVGSDRKVLITLAENAQRLENCNVMLTARGIKDMHGNDCDPITWNVLVRQNQLLWSVSDINVRKEGTETVTFDVDVVNDGATSESWVIDNLPSWLTASAESGTLMAQSSKKITFTVDPAAAAGRYEEVISLIGSLNISEPLVINLTSLVEAPNWAVEGDYEYTMSLIGRLKVDEDYSEDVEDIVAAFNGETCVGVAHPTYYSNMDSYYLMMTINGNDADANVPLSFKVFDASSGKVFSSVITSEPVNFIVDNLYGSIANPVDVVTTNYVEQTLPLAKGWTWASLFVTPKDASLATLFGGESAQYMTVVKSRNQFANHEGTDWSGSLESLTSGVMYKVFSTAASNVCITGSLVEPAKVDMKINKGWNWIGYNNSATCNLNTAFADLAPVSGDMVKGKSSFAVYSGSEWIGSLNALTPGQGYAYNSVAGKDKTFRFPTVTTSSAAKVRRMDIPEFENSNYANNMALIAIVMDGDMVVENAQVTAFCDADVRGFSSKSLMIDQENGEAKTAHFITIAGDNNGDKILFVVTVDGRDYYLSQSVAYTNDGQLGSLEAPYVLQMSQTTSVSTVSEVDGNDNLYDIVGRRVHKASARGIYIQNGQKVVRK